MGVITDFVTALAAVSVTGVTRDYTYSPASLNGADLPAKFVMPPASGYEAISTCSTEDDTITASLVVAVEAVAQDTQSANYTALLAMADNLNEALKSGRGTLGGLVTWTITSQNAEPVIVAGQAYWGVTATVTAQYF